VFLKGTVYINRPRSAKTDERAIEPGQAGLFRFMDTAFRQAITVYPMQLTTYPMQLTMVKHGKDNSGSETYSQTFKTIKR
jgi:hypothetical protein